jgi:LuxR family maltose regulon positive regulatory protein
MGDSELRQRTGPSHGADGPGFDLLTAKLHRPLVRPGTVRRSSLIERLKRGDGRPITSVVAPAGYGKTTVLAQWAERNGQAFAWVSVDEADNDPKVLLTYVAKALDAVEPVGERVFDALASPGSSVPGSVVPRLGSAFSSMASPVALVLDDVHALHNSQCRAALSVLADHVPGGSRLVLAGRAEPPLRIARLRAEGKITEIGPADLASQYSGHDSKSTARPSSARRFSSRVFSLADSRASRVRARRWSWFTNAASTAWLRLRNRRRPTSSSTRSSRSLSSVRATFVFGMVV